MVKWMLKKFINPDTLTEAAIEKSCECINNRLAQGDAAVIAHICEVGEILTCAGNKVCGYVKDGTIDEAERAELISFLSPIVKKAFNMVLA